MAGRLLNERISSRICSVLGCLGLGISPLINLPRDCSRVFKVKGLSRKWPKSKALASPKIARASFLSGGNRCTTGMRPYLGWRRKMRAVRTLPMGTLPSTRRILHSFWRKCRAASAPWSTCTASKPFFRSWSRINSPTSALASMTIILKPAIPASTPLENLWRNPSRGAKAIKAAAQTPRTWDRHLRSVLSETTDIYAATLR